MLYCFDPNTHELDPCEPSTAASINVAEEDIEKSLAGRPDSIFVHSAREGPPVLVVKKSVRGAKMADIIALDAEGRLVLVECKRGWADRHTLAQLMDYASDYAKDPFTKLQDDWVSGEGTAETGNLLEHLRSFADDLSIDQDSIGKEHVLVVVAAGKDDGFQKIADYLSDKGLVIHFVGVHFYRRSNGEVFLEVNPIRLDPSGQEDVVPGKQVWMVNTDETYTPGAYRKFLEKGVLGIWGYQDGPRTLQQGAMNGDVVYAYLNGVGIISRGTIVDAEVYQATRDDSLFDECPADDNEWHMRIDWKSNPKGLESVSNAEVRKATGLGLPVRNSFCRLRQSKVIEYLETRWS